MTILLKRSIRVTGIELAAGTQQAFSNDLESALVANDSASWISNPNRGGLVPVMGEVDDVTGKMGFLAAGIKMRPQSADTQNIGTHAYAIGNMSGVAVTSTFGPTPTAQPVTFGATFEVPTDFDEIRLVFASSSASIVIAAASVAPCSSIADDAARINNANFSASATPLLFDGAASATIPLGTTGPTAQPVLFLSDPLPWSNIPRTDGGTLPLVSARVALTCASSATVVPAWYCKKSNFNVGGGLKWHATGSYNTAGDFTAASMPGSQTYDWCGAIVGVQYRSRRGVMSTLWVGDSITAGSALTVRNNHGFAHQSAPVASSASMPIDTAVCGMGGTKAPVWRQFIEAPYAGLTGGVTGIAAGSTNLDVLQPSHLMLPSWAVNDALATTITTAQIATMRREVSRMAAAAQRRRVTTVLWHGVPKGDGAAYYDATDITHRQAHNADALTWGYWSADIGSSACDSARPLGTIQYFAAAMSDDGVHPNDAADILITTDAAALLALVAKSYFSG